MRRISERFITRVRMRLEDEQTDRLRKVEDLTRCRVAIDRVPEPFIGDDADQAVVSTEQRQEYLELKRITSSVRTIGAALLSMEHGRYGICLRCDEPIPSRRLRVLPSAILCRECQEAAESGQAQGWS